MNEHLAYLWRGAKVAAFMVAWGALVVAIILSLVTAGEASPKVFVVVFPVLVLLLVCYGLGRLFSEKPYAPVHQPKIPRRTN